MLKLIKSFFAKPVPPAVEIQLGTEVVGVPAVTVVPAPAPELPVITEAEKVLAAKDWPFPSATAPAPAPAAEEAPAKKPRKPRAKKAKA